MSYSISRNQLSEIVRFTVCHVAAKQASGQTLDMEAFVKEVVERFEPVSVFKYRICALNVNSHDQENVEAYVQRLFGDHRPKGVDWGYAGTRPCMWIASGFTPSDSELADLERALRNQGFSTYDGHIK